MPLLASFFRAALLLSLAAATLSSAAPIDKRLVVAGSSVPKGQGTYFSGVWFDADYDDNGSDDNYAIYGYANRLRQYLTEPVDMSEPPLSGGDGASTTAWSFRNVSVAGNSTGALSARFNPDVTGSNPEYVLLALSMGNEGLPYGGDPDMVFETFRTGMLDLIQDVRDIGAYPVVGLVYPHGRYSIRDYGYVKEMNRLMNTWNVPSINLLGAIDDGRGRWAEGFVLDDAHPNYPGHEAMYHAIVPSLFDAIEAGKRTTPAYPASSGYARITQDLAQSAPLSFTPAETMHAFNTSFRVRSTHTGTVAAVRAKSEPHILIDFGPNTDAEGRATTGPDAFGRYWNSWRPGAAGANEITTGTSLSSLVNVDNGATTIGVEVTWPFRGANGISAGGLTGPDEDALGTLAIDTATEDYFYVESGVNSGFGVLKLTGLDTSKTYTLRLFGTRNTTAPRTTRYTIKCGHPFEPYAFLTTSGSNIGSDGQYNGNNDEVALFANVPPDAQGAIEVIVSVEEGSFAYLGILELSLDETSNRFGTVELRDSEIAYVAPDGREITYPADGDGGLWHDIALSHRFAAQDTLLYVDGVLAGALKESFEPNQFILGGSGMAGSDSPLSADYQDWCVHRAAWTEDEALAQHEGALQQASLEILAPLDDASFASGDPVANDAQSLSEALVNTTSVVAGTPVNAPSLLSGASYGRSGIELSWIDNSLTETAFILERRASRAGQRWATIATLPANTSHYLDAGLSRGLAYDYRLSTDEGGMRSTTSNVLTLVTGSDGQTYREWAAGYFNLPTATYRIDFNTSASPSYGAEVWNTVSALGNGSYPLVDNDNDSSAGYVLHVTDAFNQFRSGNGSPLPDFPAAAQASYFVVDDPLQPDGAQILLSGLNREAVYRITLFGRRAGPVSGFDYIGRYTFTGNQTDGNTAVSFELDCADNTEPREAYLRPDSGGNIVIDITGADDPSGNVFAGINFLILDELPRLPPTGAYLVDFSARASPSYPAGQTWNTIASVGTSAAMPLFDIDGSSADGYTYEIATAFNSTRENGSALTVGFAASAESTMFRAHNTGSSITFGNLDPGTSYDLVFLARRSATVGGFDYNGTYTVADQSGSTTRIVDGGTADYVETVSGLLPTGTNEITLTVAKDDTINSTDTDFPVLNLVMLIPQSAAGSAFEPGDDPGAPDLTNLEKYAYGLDPTIDGQNQPSFTGIGLSGSHFTASYTRSRTASGSAIVIESTTDLTQTTDTWATDPSVTEMMTSGDNMMETVRFQRNINSDTQRFFRGKVEAIGP